MLRTAFRRSHNFIHGNEGMPKDAAFWQFLYLIFAKMHDERQPNDARRFLGRPLREEGPANRRAVRSCGAEGDPRADRAAFRRCEEEVLNRLPWQRRDHALRPCSRVYGRRSWPSTTSGAPTSTRRAQRTRRSSARTYAVTAASILPRVALSSLSCPCWTQNRMSACLIRRAAPAAFLPLRSRI